MLSPLFSLIATCLQKIVQDRASGVLLVPLWETQPWFTFLLHLLVDKPRLLPQSDTMLVQPHSNALHPLRKQIRLIACKVSGKPSTREGFQAKLERSCYEVSCSGDTQTICTLHQEMDWFL